MQSISQRYVAVRQQFETICAPLTIEDFGLQAMPETSPAKWHLAHTSWFFETFLLKPYLRDYQPWNDHYEVLFNSYYNAIGDQYPRAQRHLISRPTVAEVYEYRQYIDEHMLALLCQTGHQDLACIEQRTILGIHHEQQHQELFFTDLKYCLFQNPLYPAYEDNTVEPSKQQPSRLGWLANDGGLVSIGVNESSQNFCFDNETPSHQVFLNPYQIADRLVTNADYLQFIADGGYQESRLWLSDGWTEVNNQHWQSPLYWVKRESEWFHFTLYGLQPLDLNQPVSHISFYEADAYARWADARLASEFEWEVAVAKNTVEGPFIESGILQPMSQADDERQFFGYLWQWTTSAYQPYPGFSPAEGAIGEYNGKFMCNQQVLRGGSFVTPHDHFRKTYRNFFYPRDRWQFTGIRMAKSG